MFEFFKDFLRVNRLHRLGEKLSRSGIIEQKIGRGWKIATFGTPPTLYATTGANHFEILKVGEPISEAHRRIDALAKRLDPQVNDMFRSGPDNGYARRWLEANQPKIPIPSEPATNR